MKWKNDMPTPEYGDYYVFADFEPSDTVMKCDLSHIFHGGVEKISAEDYHNPTPCKDRTDFYYYTEENGVKTYYWFYTFDKVMTDPVGCPVFSHYTELEYPKGDF